MSASPLVECRIEYVAGSLLLILRCCTRWKTVGFRNWTGYDTLSIFVWIFLTLIYSMEEYLCETSSQLVHQHALYSGTTSWHTSCANGTVAIVGAPIGLSQTQRDALDQATRESYQKGAKGMFASFYFLICLVWSLKGCLIIFFLRLT